MTECNHIWQLYTYKKYICINCKEIKTEDQLTWIPSKGRYVEE